MYSVIAYVSIGYTPFPSFLPTYRSTKKSQTMLARETSYAVPS